MTGRSVLARRTTQATLALALAAVLAACAEGFGGPAGASPTGAAPTDAPVATPAESMPGGSMPGSTPGSTPDASAASPSPAGAILTQDWATAALTDVRNGETFRIADLVASGRVVFIETMAIWCTNCRAQQRDVVTALAELDPDRVTWIGVDVEASESAEALAEYSRTLGFDWPFVVASTDLARALAGEFGDRVLSPPSTPIIVIGTDGTVTMTEFGHKSVDRIVELAAAHGA
ncbi:MAG TPA: hypothetical protein VFX65_06540 [Candidatus Limnocylindrales bacterium]|nr:hypothetical protein [Candidatus Limnocylindrales bacterium]